MARLVHFDELAKAAKSTLIKDHAGVYGHVSWRDVEKAMGLLIMVKETQLRTCENMSFLRKMRGFLNGFGFGGGEGVF
ncbi:hypothetical protein Tco_1189565 [Tanacetum coccineum]